MPIKLFQGNSIVTLQDDDEEYSPESYPIYEAIGVGWTLLGVAMTSMPHLRQRGHEIEMSGDEVKVPIYRLGIYWHPFAPNGQLVFDELATAQMIENYNRSVTDYNVSLNKSHYDDDGSIAFLDKQDGGRLNLEDSWLVAYGPPVDDAAIEMVNSKKWRYASGEFSLDYTSNLLYEFSRQHPGQELSLGEVEKPPRIYLKDAVRYQPTAKKIWSASMKKRKIQIGDFVLEVAEGEPIHLTDEHVNTLVAQAQHDAESITQLTGRVEELEQENVELRNTAPQDEMAGWPEAAKQAVLAMRQQAEETTALQRQQAEEFRLQNIALVVSNAESRMDNGRQLSPILIQLCQAGMTLSGFADSETSVKLTNSNNLDALQKYHDSIYKLILQRTPGQVPSDDGDDDDIHLTSPIENGHGPRNYTSEEFEAAKQKYMKQHIGSEVD